jgi:glycosyltransferase involved in cell wall biosynthesis
MIPTSNKAKYLRRSFMSASIQTLSSFEVVVIDDASNDFSLTIISEFLTRDSRFRLEINDKPLRGHTTRSFGVYHSKGMYLLALDCDDELLNRTAEIDFQTAIQRNSDMVEHHALTIKNDGTVVPFCWPAPIQEADNVTLVRTFLKGQLNWQLWLRFIQRIVYQRAVELIGERLLLQNARATDKLHCAAMFPFVRKFVMIDYIGYLYYIGLPESSVYRTYNGEAECKLVDNVIKEILVPFVGNDRQTWILKNSNGKSKLTRREVKKNGWTFLFE